MSLGEMERIQALTHKVTRYGHIYDLVIDTIGGENYHADDLPIEDQSALLSLGHGDKICIYDTYRKPTGPELYLRAIEPIGGTLHPTCQHCGGLLTEGLGTLYCTQAGCSGRLRSRLYHFFKMIPVITDTHDIRSFVDSFLDQCAILKETAPKTGSLKTMYIGGSLVEALMALLSTEEDSGYDAYRVYLKEYLRHLNTSCQILNISSSAGEAIGLSEFITSLSIPCITTTHISDTLIMCQERGEVLSIFSYLADLCVELGGDNGRFYQNELRSIEEFILMSESFREIVSRDVTSWY